MKKTLLLFFIHQKTHSEYEVVNLQPTVTKEGGRVKILIDMKLLALFSVIVGFLINVHQLFFELVKNGHPKLPSAGILMRSVRNIFSTVRPSVRACVRPSVCVCVYTHTYV